MVLKGKVKQKVTALSKVHTSANINSHIKFAIVYFNRHLLGGSSITLHWSLCNTRLNLTTVTLSSQVNR